MATSFKWVGPTDRGTVLTTELNALGIGAFSAVGPAYDNTTNLDEWGAIDIVLASLTPTTGAYLQIFLVVSLDGTTYEDAPSATQPGSHQLVATVSLNVSTSAKRVCTIWFRLPPNKFKFVLKNASGVALGATLNTCTLKTANEQGI
jgi:hypothetical protein